MTTKEIQKSIGKMKVLSFHTPVCENVKYLLHHWEMDVMSISKSGMMYEYEVKISRSDFKADLKKNKQHYYKKENLMKIWTPNYFSYACPTDLIKIEEIPDYAGLYYCENGEVSEIRKPKRLHDTVHNRIKILEKICRVNSERQFLDGCRMTYENKEYKKRVDEIMSRKNIDNEFVAE